MPAKSDWPWWAPAIEVYHLGDQPDRRHVTGISATPKPGETIRSVPVRPCRSAAVGAGKDVYQHIVGKVFVEQPLAAAAWFTRH